MLGNHDISPWYKDLSSTSSPVGSVADHSDAACWASSSHNAAGCTGLEQQLRACMDAPVCASIFWMGFQFASTIESARFHVLDVGLRVCAVIETQESEEEYDQLSSHATVPEDRRTT